MILVVMDMVENKELFNLENSELKDFLKDYSYPFEILPDIYDLIIKIGSTLKSEYEVLDNNIWIHKSVKIGQGVEIIGPAIIMENTTLRHNAYIRENVIIGPSSVIGNSCEIKNSILLEHCEIPHFNYVGDSILGNYVHLGAGVILSNLRLDKKNIKINDIDTNLRKVGAFIGDNVQVGVNSILCPGTIIYPNVFIYPQKTVKGIVKDNKEITVARL